MGLQHSPSIATSGLVMCIDAANPKTYIYRENLIPNSANLFNTVTSTFAAVNANNTTAPDGTLTATQLVENSAYSYHGQGFSITIPAGSANLPYTASMYVKANTRTCIALDFKEGTVFTQQAYAHFDVANNTVLTTYAGVGAVVNGASITPVSNGWSRLVLTATLNTSNTVVAFETRVLANTTTGSTSYNFTYTGDGVSNLYVWGPQFQQSTNVTSYTTTTGTSIPKSNTVIDIMGNNQQIYLANNTTQSLNKQYFIIDGVSSIGCSSPMATLPAGSTFTQEALIYLSATSSGQQTIFTRGQSGAQFNYGMVINANLNQLCFRNSLSDYVLQSDSLTPGNWYHLVISTTSLGSTGYVNGVQKNTVSNTNTGLNANYNYWTMGCRPTPGPAIFENFFGNIALFRVYHGVALTLDQVLQNFNSCRGRFGL